MNEVVSLLSWLHDQQIPDTTIARYLGVRRETVNRVRHGNTKNRANGFTWLADLKDMVAIVEEELTLHMPAYQTSRKISHVPAPIAPIRQSPAPMIAASAPIAQVHQSPAPITLSMNWCALCGTRENVKLYRKPGQGEYMLCPTCTSSIPGLL